jgi:hypothetical protein
VFDQFLPPYLLVLLIQITVDQMRPITGRRGVIRCVGGLLRERPFGARIG